eukprot:10109422-Alexandrium_andersonii.AAC.1
MPMSWGASNSWGGNDLMALRAFKGWGLRLCASLCALMARGSVLRGVCVLRRRMIQTARTPRAK